MDEVIINIDKFQNDDYISRQAVIERLKKEGKILYTTKGLNYLIRVIEELPSVIPVIPTCKE